MAKQRRSARQKPMELPADFIRKLVDMANANDAHMDGTIGPVLELVAGHDLVFGVWQDSAEAAGVGLLIVKGANRLRESVATGVGLQCRTTAIKCVEYAQAEALRRHVDTDRTH